jgi:transcriptional regulator with XRE-family HTH domain
MDALIANRLFQLREQKKLSRSQLSRLTVHEGFAGVPESTIKAIEKSPGRVPETRILEALALALNVRPEVFYEYPIALARSEGSEARSPASDVAQGEPSAALQTLAKHARSRRAEARSESHGVPDVKRDTGQGRR